MNIVVKPTDNALQRTLIEQVIEHLHELTPGETYTVAAILGDEFWDETDDSHKAIGQCFSHLVNSDRLPFEPAGWNSVRHNLYHFKP